MSDIAELNIAPSSGRAERFPPMPSSKKTDGDSVCQVVEMHRPHAIALAHADRTTSPASGMPPPGLCSIGLKQLLKTAG